MPNLSPSGLPTSLRGATLDLACEIGKAMAREPIGSPRMVTLNRIHLNFTAEDKARCAAARRDAQVVR